MMVTMNDDSLTEEEEEQAIAPHPQPKDSPVTTTTATQTSTAEPEEAMKGLFGQLLHSMSERTEKKIADLLPQMVGKDLATLVAKTVEAEVRTQMGASLSEERLTQVLEPLLMTALPKVLSREMSLLEPIIRQSVFETASPVIKERIDQFVREEINAVRTALSDMVREQLGSLEGLDQGRDSAGCREADSRNGRSTRPDDSPRTSRTGCPASRAKSGRRADQSRDHTPHTSCVGLSPPFRLTPSCSSYPCSVWLSTSAFTRATFFRCFFLVLRSFSRPVAIVSPNCKKWKRNESLALALCESV